MKTTRKSAPPSKAQQQDAEVQVASFIQKFEPKTQTLIRSLRKALGKRLPTANQLVYDNYNFFVIGYCTTERPSDCILSIAAAANGVGLLFYYGATLPDAHHLLLGDGKQNRFYPARVVGDSCPPRGRCPDCRGRRSGKTPLPKTGQGQLIIRSISKKQRPRRKAVK
jgi:hypothetical protein